MSAHITAPSALRPLTLLAALFFTLLAGPALAQVDGGHEGRKYHFVADPGGANIHFATAWFGGGESIWRAEAKVDSADLAKGIDIDDKGIDTVPTTLYTSFTSTTLTGTTTYYEALSWERPSDSKVDFMMSFELEANCTTDCLVESLNFLMVDDMETDFDSPSQSSWSLDYTTSFNGISGDLVETHNAH